jgi:glycosyltransferase
VNESVKVSVVTASYNSAKTIGATIQSVNAQSYANIEQVFIDGGSTDDTLSVISASAGKNHSVLSESDNGIYDALNKGVQRATGDVVGFLHADDFYTDDSVVKRIADCFSRAEVQAVYGDLQYVSQSDTDKVIRTWDTKPFSPGRLKRGWMPPHPTLYIRKEWYERIGGFDTQYRIAADYLSILQLFSYPDFDAVYLPQVLVKMRVGGASNRSLKNIIQKSREDYGVLKRAGVGGLGTVMCKNIRKAGQFGVKLVR